MPLDFPSAPNQGDTWVGSNGVTYIWDGTKWVAMGSSPGTGVYLPLAGGTMLGALNWTATGSLTSRSAQDRSADAVNVRDFGAVGDGATDDTAAFQAAIATGHVIHVPRGSYLTGPLVLNQSIYGDGIDATVLIISPSTTGMPTMITWADPGPSTIRDLTIDGRNLLGAGNLAGAGIMTATNIPQTALRIEDVEVRNIGEANATVVRYAIMINWDQTTTNLKSACVISHCYVHDIVGAGITAGGQGHIISNNTITNCGHSGVNCWGQLIDGVIANNTINTTGTNPNTQSDGITGYDPTNLRVLVIGNTIENSLNHGIHLGGNNIQIVGNKIHGVTAGSGIMLQSAPNSSPTPTSNGLISSNEIDTVQQGSGIRCGWFSQVAITGNTIYNIGAVLATSAAGVAVLASADCTCTGNLIVNVGNAGNGIVANTALNLIVSGNRIATVGGSGIRDLGGSTGMIAYGNVITGEATPTVPNFAGPPPPWAPTASPTFTGTISNTGTLAGGLITGTTIGTTTSPVGQINTSGPVNSAAPVNMFAAATGQPVNHYIDTVVAQTRSMYVTSNGVARWRWYWAIPGPESGNQAGADFALQAFNDDGSTSFQPVQISRATGMVSLRQASIGFPGYAVGFYGVTPVARQTVSGSRSDPTQALTNLLTALGTVGLINNTTVP